MDQRKKCRYLLFFSIYMSWGHISYRKLCDKVRTYQQPPLPETWLLVNSLGDLSEMPRRLLGLSLLLGADTMDDDPSNGTCSVVGDVLDNRLEGLGLLVEGRLLTSVAVSERSCGIRLGVLRKDRRRMQFQPDRLQGKNRDK